MGKYIKTEEHCRNISFACKGRKSWNKGIKMKEESRLKMIASQKGKHWSIKSELKKGNHLRFKDGLTVIGGYLHLYFPEHPCAKTKHYVLVHRLIMEHYLKRILLPTERVHHLNFNKLDNRIENLIYFKNESEHQLYHYKIKYLKDSQTSARLALD